jgi:hypothetical protein
MLLSWGQSASLIERVKAIPGYPGVNDIRIPSERTAGANVSTVHSLALNLKDSAASSCEAVGRHRSLMS